MWMSSQTKVRSQCRTVINVCEWLSLTNSSGGPLVDINMGYGTHHQAIRGRTIYAWTIKLLSDKRY